MLTQQSNCCSQTVSGAEDPRGLPPACQPLQQQHIPCQSLSTYACHTPLYIQRDAILMYASFHGQRFTTACNEDSVTKH